MSDAVNSPGGPRRSQRDKKQATQFLSVNSALAKRKRSDETSDDEVQSKPSEPEDEEESGHEDADNEEDFAGPKPKPVTKRKAKALAKPKGPPAAKKPRTTKASAKVKLPPAPKAKRGTGKTRGKKTAVDGVTFDAEQVAKDTKIAGDNALFNAIMNPFAALQSTAEDFLESLPTTPGASQAELINCILRACGCNDSVNADEVVDYDGVVDALDNFTEALKQDDSPVYPLTSKLPAFKKFRKSLSEFLSRLVSSAAALGQLYISDLIPTLQAWVVAMSSSQIRAFRHTATVVALEVETALCEVAAEVEKEAETVSRQREGERKRKNDGNAARVKELQAKAGEVRERRTKVAEFLKEFVDGVFVHRYRDLDPNIRAECVRAMGLWFERYASHFIDGAYLRYVGWVLSDSNTGVRLEAVRALSRAYDQPDHISVGALQHFTERFKSRLVEMAMGDTEMQVRIAVVQVLQAINTNGLLEDEQAEKLCLLVFDEEAKIRRAVSGFVKGVWEEKVEERLVGKKATGKEKNMVGVKVLVMLLVKWGKMLDSGKNVEDEDLPDDESQSETSSRRTKGKAIMALAGTKHKGRTSLAVEALWDEIESVGDWETLLEVLLLDHSAAGEAPSSQSRGRRTKNKKAAEPVDEAWRLEEVEEGSLLEVFIASLRKTKLQAVGAKKGEDEVITSSITRALIKSLPALLMKYQSDESRMSDVLLLPQLMNLDEYLEMRMMTAYSTLWEDITKQFLSHSAPAVLTNAVATIRYMLDTTSLSNANSTKILELEEELASSLRDAIADRDELEVASFNEDEVLALTAICARLSVLAGTRDMIAWMEEDEGGKQTSAWDIVSALADRGRLGYKEEEQMIDQALQVLYLHVLWKARALTSAPEPSEDEVAFRDKLKEQRDALLERLLEFAVGTQSNTAEGVRRAAFQNLMNLHILFCQSPGDAPLPTSTIALSFTDEVQYRCAGFVQAEIERYAEELEELAPDAEDESDEEESDLSDSGDEDAPKRKKRKKGKGKKAAAAAATVNKSSSSHLEREYAFMNVIATFLRAIKTGAIHYRHSSTLLAHFGRLGPVYDLCSKVIVDILREEGMYNGQGAAVVEVFLQSLQDSFQLYLDGITDSEDHTVSLAKSLAGALMIRGAHLAVVRRLDSQFVVETHTSALTWIGKRLGAYETAKNKKALSKALMFFKVLVPLSSMLDSRDSVKIKAHLDQVLASANMEVLPTSKLWEGYRAYEKRLTSAKDKVTGEKGKKASKKAHKSAEIITTDDDDDFVGKDAEPEPAPRPKPRPVRRPAQQQPDAEDDANPPSEPEIDVATPRQRSGSVSQVQSPALFAMPQSPAPASAHSSPDPFTTPSNPRKRARSPDEEGPADVQEEEEAQVQDDDAESRLSEPPASPAPLNASQETHIRDVVHAKLPGKSVVLLGSYEAAVDLLEKRSAVYSQKTMTEVLNLIGWEWNIAVVAYDADWRVHRRITHQYFNKDVVQEYQSTQRDEIRASLLRILDSPEDALKHVHQIFVTIVLNIVYGMRNKGLDDDYIELAQKAGIGFSIALTPGAWWVDFLPILKYIYSWVPGTASRKVGEEYKPFIEAMRDTPFDNVKRQFTRRDAKPCIVASLIPDLQEHHKTTDLTREQDRMTRGATGALYAVGAMHPVQEDDVYKGYLIPKDAAVLANGCVRAMLHDPEVYPDPEAFKPERFIKDGKINPNVRDPAAIAFGFRRRICPRRFLVASSLNIFAAHMLYTFDIAAGKDEYGNPIELNTEVGDGVIICVVKLYSALYRPDNPRP
ncbi:hypothetical protein EUX98_g3693 [Antrodiella citrinella]|uniref:SCD domain-containing protein n=1 Tax=Antrodiella citrinella TaxID=2447956 RepID=A0A4S4MYB6_9APHY|nr:hypothetical protein EUX98_g3693 [Antrodiella citrinella]